MKNIWRVHSEHSVGICGAEIWTGPWRVQASGRLSGQHRKWSLTSPIVMPQLKCLGKKGEVAPKAMFGQIIGETSDEVVSWRAPARRGNYLGGKRETPPTHTHQVGFRDARSSNM